MNFLTDGLNTTTSSKTYNSELGTLLTPTRECYIFKGWFTEPTGGTEITSETLVPANDVTYYAHWTNTYEIQFNKNAEEPLKWLTYRL